MVLFVFFKVLFVPIGGWFPDFVDGVVHGSARFPDPKKLEGRGLANWDSTPLFLGEGQGPFAPFGKND